MRRVLCSVLLCGCFGEPTDNKTASTSIVLPMTTGDESSSDDGGSSTDESSTTEDPRACPDWCGTHCDTLPGGFELCVCGSDIECGGDTSCDRADGQVEAGHCV